MSAALADLPDLPDLPDLDADAGSGLVARRAVIRWGWRLFRRE